MVAAPEVLYGKSIGSSYQLQTDTLSKHFRRVVSDEPRETEPPDPRTNPGLFDEIDTARS
jgi:hypothetical protein